MGIRLSRALLFIGVLALFLGAMRGPSEWVERTLFVAAYLGYTGLTVAALVRGQRSPGLIGFVVCGWAYLMPVLIIESKRWERASPFGPGVVWVVSRWNAPPALPPGQYYVPAIYTGDLGDGFRVDIGKNLNAITGEFT